MADKFYVSIFKLKTTDKCKSVLHNSVLGHNRSTLRKMVWQYLYFSFIESLIGLYAVIILSTPDCRGT